MASLLGGCWVKETRSMCHSKRLPSGESGVGWGWECFPKGMGHEDAVPSTRVCYCVQWLSDPQLKWEAGSWKKCDYSLTQVDLVVLGNKRHRILHKLLSVGRQGAATQLLQARAPPSSHSLLAVSPGFLFTSLGISPSAGPADATHTWAEALLCWFSIPVPQEYDS